MVKYSRLIKTPVSAFVIRNTTDNRHNRRGPLYAVLRETDRAELCAGTQAHKETDRQTDRRRGEQRGGAGHAARRMRFATQNRSEPDSPTTTVTHITGRSAADTNVSTKTSNYFSSPDFYCNIAAAPARPTSCVSNPLPEWGRSRVGRNSGRRAVPGHIRRGEQR